ncbi:MAG: acyl-CoA/acyl-ACP dehydrogenase [Alphaproteobacteria bacterium]|nr:acyl-CoA/acyl-ACP dehydrogenase [Alphaproteobacteria bacterium]
MAGPEQTRAMVAETAARLFAAQEDDALAAAETGEWPSALWDAITENGLDRVLVPEAQGGFGGGWEDACEILLAAGRYAAPVPLAETVAASWLLGRAGLHMPEGILTLADGDAVSLRDGKASGTLLRVPWGASATRLVAQAVDDQPDVVAVFSPVGGKAAADRNIGRDPRDTLLIDALKAEAGPGGSVMAAGALARACQMAGAVARVLDMTVAYANERGQFGRPIGKFQAIQQQLAALAGETAAANMAARMACRALDRGADGFAEVATAKIRAGEAAGRAAAIAHQVHGAIGFTDEHRLHHLTRRLWSWRAEFGTESVWAGHLGRLVAARGADSLWPVLTGGS